MHLSSSDDLSVGRLARYAYNTYVLDGARTNARSPDPALEQRALEHAPGAWLEALRTTLAFLRPNCPTAWLNRLWYGPELDRKRQVLRYLRVAHQRLADALDAACAPLAQCPTDAVAHCLVHYTEHANIRAFQHQVRELSHTASLGTRAYGRNPTRYYAQATAVLIAVSHDLAYRRGSGFTKMSEAALAILHQAIPPALKAAVAMARFVDETLAPLAFEPGLAFVPSAIQPQAVEARQSPEASTRFGSDRRRYGERYTRFLNADADPVEELYRQFELVVPKKAETVALARDYCRLALSLSAIAASSHNTEAAQSYTVETSALRRAMREYSNEEIDEATVASFLDSITFSPKRLDHHHYLTPAGRLTHFAEDYAAPLLYRAGQLTGFDRTRVAMHTWAPTLAEALGCFVQDHRGGSHDASAAFAKTLEQLASSVGWEVTSNPNGTAEPGDVDLQLKDGRRSMALQIKLSRPRWHTADRHLARTLAHAKAAAQLQHDHSDYRLIVTTAHVDIGAELNNGTHVADAHEFVAHLETLVKLPDPSIEALFNLCTRPLHVRDDFGTQTKPYTAPKRTFPIPIRANVPVTSINFHLWQPCNFRCRFCFARCFNHVKGVLPKGHLTKERALDVIDRLHWPGIEKITFAGGEPTLCPWLPDLVARAKHHGMTTMVVTNGSRLTPQYLASFNGTLDWIALSIDSLDAEVNAITGRREGKYVATEEQYRLWVSLIKDAGIRLKINTVIHRLNFQQRFHDFIAYARPERWKAFQLLHIAGENDDCLPELAITRDQFQQFIEAHEGCRAYTSLVPEDNAAMTGTYLMLDPAARLYSNASGHLESSPSILDVPFETALSSLPAFDFRGFEERGGNWNWG